MSASFCKVAPGVMSHRQQIAEYTRECILPASKAVRLHMAEALLKELIREVAPVVARARDRRRILGLRSALETARGYLDGIQTHDVTKKDGGAA